MARDSQRVLKEPISDPRWNDAALLLLQNVTHSVDGESVFGLLADVLRHLLREGGAILAWRKDGTKGGPVIIKVDTNEGGENRHLQMHSAESDLLDTPTDIPDYQGQTEVIPYARKNWSGLYFRGAKPTVEGWLLVFSDTVTGNGILDNHRICSGILAAIQRFRKLMAIGVARHRELDALVDSLCMARERDAQSRLQSSYELLQRLTTEPDDCLDLAARLGRLILTELIDNAHESQQLTQVQSALHTLHDCWQSNWKTPGDAADTVRCLIHCCAALRCRERGDLPSISDEVMALLPCWIEQQLRWPASKRKESKAEWQQVVAKTLPMLGKWLVADFDRRNKNPDHDQPLRDLPSVRNTLSLWLCLKILKTCSDPESSQRWMLACELRECLRFIAFGDRKEDLSRLCSMVAMHAAQYVPYCDVQSYTQALGRVRGINHYSASEHLRHALDIYVTGHYFLDMQLVLPNVKQSVAEALFGKSDTLVHAGKAAFSLASLFHDVDMLFLPDRSHIGERFVASMSSGGKVNVPQALQSAAITIDSLIGRACPPSDVATIIKNLEEMVVSPDDSVSTPSQVDAVEQRLHHWLAGQQNGDLEHGTLSAWFMTRMCRRDEACNPQTLRQAVRAVLLHEAHDVTVSLDEDPIAGLLVLLNEIFVWDPRWFASEALDRWINPANLSVTWDDEQGLVSELTVQANQAWPLVRIALRPNLSLRIWQICLRKARNLGRLIKKSSVGFSPEVEVISPVPEVLRSQGYTTHELLTDVLLSQVPDLGGGQTALREWLREMPTEPSNPCLIHSTEETMTLRALGESHRRLQNIPVELLNHLQDEWEGRVSSPPLQDELGPGQSLRRGGGLLPGGPVRNSLPNRREVRELLGNVLKTESDWSAFVLDNFPEVFRKFTQGMDRTAQTTLLLTHQDDKQIINELRKRLEPVSGKL